MTLLIMTIDNTYNDITYNDITYNDITYNDITYNDVSYSINKCDNTNMLLFTVLSKVIYK